MSKRIALYWHNGRGLGHTVRNATLGQALLDYMPVVRRCQNHTCPQYHRSYRPEEEGRWALPYIALTVPAETVAKKFSEVLEIMILRHNRWGKK